MGLQQLILAIAALAAIPVVDLVFPIPDPGEPGLTLHDFNSNAAPLDAPSPPTISGELASRPPLRDPFSSRSLPNSQPATNYPADSPAPEGRDVNPVQDWTGEKPVISDRRFPAQNRGGAETSACQSVSSAVVTVQAGREIGSGSIVSQAGLVITNHHVVRRMNNQSLWVKTEAGDRYSGQVIAHDRRNDLALIQLQGQSSLPTVRLAAASIPAVGQPVCAIGSPLGQSGKITTGVLVNVLPNGDLQSDVELKPGNSGGPLINAQGEMIGVNKGVARGRTGESGRVSYATNSSVVSNLVEQNRWSTSTNSNGSY